jgi:hypothetical protein
MNLAGGPGFPVTTTFTIVSPSSVPEFPVGMLVVVGITMAVVIILRAGNPKGKAPVV